MRVITRKALVPNVGAGIRDIRYGDRKHRHWHYIYKKHGKKVDTLNAREILAGQAIAITGSLVAGYLLEINKNQLLLFGGALLVLPGVIDLSASITGAMCAKINHRLDTDSRVGRVIVHSIGFSILLTICTGIIVGATAGLIGELFFDVSFWKISLLCVLALMSVGILMYPAMSLLTIVLKKSGFDPDNIVGPIETGLSDALMVFTVALLVRILA